MRGLKEAEWTALESENRRNPEVKGREAYTLEYYLPHKHATAELPPGLAILYCYARFRTDSAASARTAQRTGSHLSQLCIGHGSAPHREQH